ncbi:outer membrane protein assembly factor BamD [Gracilimonas mengyeensis]|nr:outer membrane protein assembly factor BamD [Gracilimonas mengyeensis]
MQSKFLFILGFLFLFTACKNDSLIKRGDTVDVAFEKAMAMYQNEDYVDAADAFETVTRVGRGTEYGQEAQFYLAESYFKSRQYLLAASEYDRYISYYPQDERRVDAEFKAALCYYHQSPRYKLDQTPTRNAIERFQLFNNRYPDSEYVTQAANYIDEMRNKLAHKTYEGAQFYIRTEQYEAAIIYLNQTIDRFPESKWAARALVDQVETYIAYADNSILSKQQERYEKAIEAYEKFLQLFPESDMRAEIENLHDEALNKLQDVVTGEEASPEQS